MIPTKIENIFIQVKTDLTGVILEIEAGKFAREEFVLQESIYEICPYLESVLENLPSEETLPLNTMVLVSNSKEYAIDLELTRQGDFVTILIHDRSAIYKNISLLNQNRNDLFLLKRELDQANDELKILKDLADKASEEKSRFVAIMSHEVRNPLNSILGYSEMITEDSGEPKIKNYAKSLTRAGRNLRVIVDDILDFSRIEAGKLELVLEPIFIKDIVKSCVNEFCFQRKESELEIKFIEDKEFDHFVFGDAVRITQVFSNLINNAIKFTDKGVIAVGIDVVFEDAEKIVTNIFVKDTGRGMTLDQSKTIFNEYGQSNSKDQFIGGGAGLGLSIVKRLVGIMEGQVYVESKLDVGTKFTIEIPFKKAQKGDEIEEVKAKETDFSIVGKEILFADDDLLSRKIVKHIFEKEGCIATVVSDGKEALDFLQQKSFDVILLDIEMPIMRGDELVENKELFSEFNHNTPILALTGNTGKKKQERYLALGFDVVLSKPYASAKLIKNIKTAIFKGAF